jgi:hypothetical protein
MSQEVAVTEQTSFKGPGHWRREAEKARRPDNIFAHLAEAARLLADMGKTEAQQHVHAAEAALQGGDADTAGNELRAAARAAGPGARAEAQGLRALAEQLPESKGSPARAEPAHTAPTENLPAMED